MQTSITSQNQKKPINIVLLLVCSLLILFKTMPIFQGYFSAYAEILLIVVCFFFLFPIERTTFNNLVSVFIVAALFFLFQTFCRNDEWFLNIYNILHGSFKVVLIYYLFNTTEENRRILKYLFWVLIISISITQITSIIGLEEYPLIARYSITTFGAEMIAADYGPNISAAKLNIGGYGTVYLLPVYTTLLFAFMKKRMLHPILFVCHIILSFYFIFLTEFMIGLLLYIISVVALLLTDANLKKIVLILCLAVLFFVSLSGVLSDFFHYVASNIESYNLSERFEELSSFFAGNSIDGTDLSARFDRYSKSLTVLFKNFLWGGKLVGAEGGRHSAILDYVAQGGIWGLSIMIIFFKTLYNKIFLPFIDYSYIRYIHISFIFFFIACIFNPMFYLGIMSNFIFVIAGFCVIMFEKSTKDSYLENQIA